MAGVGQIVMQGNGQHLGVTKPISTAEPTELDVVKMRFLVSSDSYESQEEDGYYEEALGQLDQIVKTWFKKINTRANGLSEELGQEANAKIFTFRLNRLGMHGPGVDTYTLCVGPHHFSWEVDFFGELHQILGDIPEVTELHPMPDSHIPVMKFKLNGISIDLVYSSLAVGDSTSKDLEISQKPILTSVDEPSDEQSVESLNGCKSILDLNPRPWTPPTPRVHDPLVPKYKRASDEERSIEVSGRLGFSFLTGKAFENYLEFNPSLFKLPPHIPTHEVNEVWGRKWIVKESSLGESIGLGIFAMEDIHLPNPLRPGIDEVPLFPFAGPIYKRRAWKSIVAQHPSWRTYELDLNGDPTEVLVRPGQGPVIDGDPVRCCNIAGYINSTQRTRPRRKPNVEWHQIGGLPKGLYYTEHMKEHVMTMAIRNIAAGEELFSNYDF